MTPSQDIQLQPQRECVIRSGALLSCKIVAFMQNMWVKNPEKIHAMIERTHWQQRDDLRLRLIRYCLFAGCVSGRRLKAALGEELCDHIIWEEATNEIADNPRVVLPPQRRHIEGALEYHDPALVITFGRVASDAVAEVWPAEILVRSPHPAARQPDTMQKIKDAADKLRTLALQLNAQALPHGGAEKT